MKQDSRLWVYNYDFEFELANELKEYRDKSRFHPWFFLNRSWHVLLPLAKPSDCILTYEDPHPDVLEYLEKKLGELPDFHILRPERESNAVFADLESQSVPFRANIGGISPWGWSPKAVSVGKAMKSPGMSRMNMRSIHWINSKKTSHILRQKNLPEDFRIPGQIIEEQDLAKETLEKTMIRLIQRYGHVFTKHPYGSAGKLSDLCKTPHFSGRKIRKWKNWIRAAGGILVEKSVPIMQEWSVQVQIEGAVPQPIAVTRLFSNRNGNYLGTLIADSDQKELDSHINSLRPVLNKIIDTGYEGPLGIDLIETATGEFKLLEINGRLTMGRTAFEWHRRISEMPFSVFTGLIFKPRQLPNFPLITKTIRKLDRLHGFTVSVLNFVPDNANHGLLISLLIEGEDPENVWSFLDILKQQLKVDLS